MSVFNEKSHIKEKLKDFSNEIYETLEKIHTIALQKGLSEEEFYYLVCSNANLIIYDFLLENQLKEHLKNGYGKKD